MTHSRKPACGACREGHEALFDFTMAFQPIVDLSSRTIVAYEALVRGLEGQGAASVLARVTEDNRYAFDQSCRVKAVELASRLGIDCGVSINFLPNAVYEAATCIRATLEAARRFNFPSQQLIFEITENEKVIDKDHLKSIIREYRRLGFKTAIDDFGAGYAGLNLLAEFQPDIIKLDMQLIRNIDQDPVRQAIVRGILGVCQTLHIKTIAEGIETLAELAFLGDCGVELFQGFLFARPATEALPVVTWPSTLPEGQG